MKLDVAALVWGLLVLLSTGAALAAAGHLLPVRVLTMAIPLALVVIGALGLLLSRNANR